MSFSSKHPVVSIIRTAVAVVVVVVVIFYYVCQAVASSILRHPPPADLSVVTRVTRSFTINYQLSLLYCSSVTMKHVLSNGDITATG